MLRRKATKAGDALLHEKETAEIKTPQSKKKVRVLGTEFKDERETALEEEILGVGDNVISALDELEDHKAKRRRKRKRRTDDDVAAKKWADSDDEREVPFEKITPSWATQFDDEKSDDSDEEVLKAHSFNTLAASSSLPSSALEFKRVTDGNKEDPCKASLRCVEFHPKATVLLTGGPDQTLRLFAIDGSKNRKIHSMFLERTPIFSAHFSRGGSEVVIGSKHKSFYVYDMEGSSGVTFRPKLKGLEVEAMSKFKVSPDGRFLAFLGKYGFVHLFSQVSKELIQSVKMNGEVVSIAFSGDGRYMYTFGSEGEVYVWDMNTRDCLHHFSDEGCINGRSLAASPDGNYVACGSQSGIVSIYDLESAMASRRPKPLKHLKNLTTSCTNMMFSPQSEILAMASKEMGKAIRLAHFPSLSVFPNFPDQHDLDLKVIQSMDFSPSSGYLALGNNKGRCLLYRLQHYTKY